ncbi:hypothetical protein CRG98_049033, partial [Punica granatum]
PVAQQPPLAAVQSSGSDPVHQRPAQPSPIAQPGPSAAQPDSAGIQPGPSQRQPVS